MKERYTRREFLGQLTSATPAVVVAGPRTSPASGVRATKRVLSSVLESPAVRGVRAQLAGACDVRKRRTCRWPCAHAARSFADGLYAEAGASRIPTSHDLTLRYARLFGLPLVPFAPAHLPSIRYAYGQRTTIVPEAAFEWPTGVPAGQKRMTPPEVRRRYIDVLADQIASPFAGDWVPASLKQYDGITRDEYLRSEGVAEAALRMMNLGSTPVARIRSFLDVLREVAVNRELRRRAGAADDQLLKIDGGNDRLPHAFAARLSDRIRYECAVLRIEHDAKGARVFFSNGGSNHSVQAGYVVCAIPFSTLRSVEFSPPLTAAKRAAIDRLPCHSATRIYLQSRARYWMKEGLSGFADTDHPMEVWDSTYGQQGARGILMSFIQGPKARELGRASRVEQLRFGLKAIEDVYPGIRKNYERGFVKVWDRDPWARGAVAYLLPGQVLSLEPHIARPEGRIHFAGEHASSLRGWMQGAFESGRRAAGEVDVA